MSSALFGRKERFNLITKTKQNFPGGPAVKTVFPVQEAWV